MTWTPPDPDRAPADPELEVREKADARSQLDVLRRRLADAAGRSGDQDTRQRVLGAITDVRGRRAQP